MAPITDDQYVITDPETGRRRWIHPEDDPPPPKAGPDGNMSPAYVAWEVRRSERRMRGEDPRRPMSEPLPMSPLDVELAELDAKIAGRDPQTDLALLKIDASAHAAIKNPLTVIATAFGSAWLRASTTVHADQLTKFGERYEAERFLVRDTRVRLASGLPPKIPQFPRLLTFSDRFVA
jgi:hypothetical protein